MELTATEKLLKKHFGIKNFAEVIQHLQKEPEKTFSQELMVSKEQFIENIKRLDRTICLYSEAYSEGLKMAATGSIWESFGSMELGNLMPEYKRLRKRMVHHLSYFYKPINK